MRRSLVIALHWAVVLLVLAMTEGGSAAPGFRWAFTGAVALWLGVMLAGGPLGRPGPKLQGWSRAIYRPLHVGLYALSGVAATLNGAELLGLLAPGPSFNAIVILLVAGLLHGIFHLWRHTALYDGALRLMTPRVLHKYL